MRVTKNWLVKHDACSDGMSFVTEHKLIGSDECDFIRQLVKLDEHEWALWLLVRRLKIKDRIRFAVYCAKDVLPTYEHTYPNDDRPRKSIEAAEACIKSNTKKNRDAARDAARTTSWTVWGASWAARAAKAAATAASRAAWEAADVASNDQSAMSRYIEYGVGLLEDK